MLSQPLTTEITEEFFPPKPNIDDIVTEDDTPVDNIFSEKQQRLLSESLYSSWQPARPFVALANVGLFYAIKKPPLVPDILISLDVEMPEDIWAKHHRSYFMWEYGKPPEMVIEIVSNQKGHETESKLDKYAQLGIAHYAIFDPEQILQNKILRVYNLNHLGYIETIERWFPKLGLGLGLWEGKYENWTDTWLRWYDKQGDLILTGAEQTSNAKQRADEAQQRADEAEQRATKMATYLRNLGVDPDNL
jgi:Uma2 family endonuclease